MLHPAVAEKNLFDTGCEGLHGAVQLFFHSSLRAGKKTLDLVARDV
jgi:hypothetical protein